MRSARVWQLLTVVLLTVMIMMNLRVLFVRNDDTDKRTERELKELLKGVLLLLC